MGFFDKIQAGLAKTRAALTGALDDLFDNADKIDEALASAKATLEGMLK